MKTPQLTALLLVSFSAALAQQPAPATPATPRTPAESAALLGQTPLGTPAQAAPATMTAADSTRLLNTVTLLDVPAGHWALEAVRMMVQQGYITGYADGTFRGNQPLTRYQAALILARILNTVNVERLTPQQREVLQKGVESVTADLQVIRGQLVTLGDSITVQSQELAALREQRGQDVERVAALEGQIVALQQQVALLTTGLQDLRQASAALALGTAPVAVAAQDAAPVVPDVSKQPDVPFTPQAEVPARLTTPNLAVGVYGSFAGRSLTPGVAVDLKPLRNTAITLQPYVELGLGEVKSTALGLNALYSFGGSGNDLRPYGLLGAGGLVSEAWTSSGTATDPYLRGGFGAEYRLANTLTLFGDVFGNYYFSNKGVGTGLSQDAARGTGFGARAGVKLRF